MLAEPQKVLSPNPRILFADFRHVLQHVFLQRIDCNPRRIAVECHAVTPRQSFNRKWSRMHIVEIQLLTIENGNLEIAVNF